MQNSFIPFSVSAITASKCDGADQQSLAQISQQGFAVIRGVGSRPPSTGPAIHSLPIHDAHPIHVQTCAIVNAPVPTAAVEGGTPTTNTPTGAHAATTIMPFSAYPDPSNRFTFDRSGQIAFTIPAIYDHSNDAIHPKRYQFCLSGKYALITVTVRHVSPSPVPHLGAPPGRVITLQTAHVAVDLPSAIRSARIAAITGTDRFPAVHPPLGTDPHGPPNKRPRYSLEGSHSPATHPPDRDVAPGHPEHCAAPRHPVDALRYDEPAQFADTLPAYAPGPNRQLSGRHSPQNAAHLSSPPRKRPRNSLDGQGGSHAPAWDSDPDRPERRPSDSPAAQHARVDEYAEGTVVPMRRNRPPVSASSERSSRHGRSEPSSSSSGEGSSPDARGGHPRRASDGRHAQPPRASGARSGWYSTPSEPEDSDTGSPAGSP
ncbi:hypothetical protein BV25DRAFT_1922859 [Artomyces pyxidatus]|uniref:Uncharacterized protein n=1 Tax=Artomyces pyxidatus TaxID=48021 RepID=A0ACB8SE47_9AGAM|nr:hypothetical protein BV25DRAFT_1922859 [Artomyces pyxidatus]